VASADMSKRLGSELERIVLERIANNRLVLPAMPSVPQRCLDILRDPDFNVRKLVKELEAEPVLALLIVRAANSASYGRGNASQALDQAVVRIGARQLKTLITEYAVNELFDSSNRQLKDANRKVWEHSVAVALLARDIAALVGNVEPDTCYLAGLLHDIGKPVLGAMMLEIDRKLGRATPGWIDVSAWTQIIEGSHRKVGVAVAAEWKLPDAIAGRDPRLQRLRWLGPDLGRQRGAAGQRAGQARGLHHRAGRRRRRRGDDHGRDVDARRRALRGR